MRLLENMHCKGPVIMWKNLNNHRRPILCMMLLFVCMFSSTAASSGLWVSAEDGFGANFPADPTRVDAATAQGTGYVYQYVQSFDNGAAIFAITVVPSLSEAEKKYQKVTLETIHSEALRLIGVPPDQNKFEWVLFGDGKNRLNYEFDCMYDGSLFKGLGFWIIDGNRAIRVSIAYTGTLSNQQIRKASSFLDTFAIFSRK